MSLKSAENRVRNQGVAYKLHDKNNKSLKSAESKTRDQGVAYKLHDKNILNQPRSRPGTRASRTNCMTKIMRV